MKAPENRATIYVWHDEQCDFSIIITSSIIKCDSSIDLLSPSVNIMGSLDIYMFIYACPNMRITPVVFASSPLPHRPPPVTTRVSVLVLVGVSILWIPIIRASQGSQLFVYIQQVSTFLQPPICAVYLLAVFWERTNEQVGARVLNRLVLFNVLDVETTTPSYYSWERGDRLLRPLVSRYK